MIFIGREKERETIHRLIAERDRAIFCIKAPSKMGKTHLALKLLEELNKEPNTFCGFYRTEGPSTDPIYPLLDALRQIFDAYDKSESPEKVERTIGRAFTAATRNKAGELLGAVVQDAMGSLVKQLTKHLDLSKTTKTLRTILSDASETWTTSAELSTMLAEHKQPVVSGFLQHCRNLAEFADPEDRFVFLFDQVEDDSDLFWDFLIALARNLPERFYLGFTLNEEHDRGIDFLKEHGAELSSHATQEIGLEGFTLDELRDLIAAHKKPPKDLGTLEAARRVTGGRPYLLNAWIDSDDYDQGVVPEDEGRFNAYHRKRLLACPEETRRMAKALSLLPAPLPSGLEDYRDCFRKTSQDEVEELVETLVQHGIFRRFPQETWFVHEEMQTFIREDMDQAIRKDRAKALMEGLQALDHNLMEGTSPYSLLAAAVLPWTDDYENAYKLNAQWGNIFYNLSEYLSAWEHYQRAVKAAEVLGVLPNKSYCFNELGLICNLWGRSQEALSYYEQALPIFREVGERAGEAATLNNIGLVHHALGQNETALEHFEQALPICREVGDRAGEAATLSNIGGVYDALGQNEKALKYYEQALPIHREVGDRRGEATTLNNIGLVYSALGQNETALEHFEQALPIRREVGDRAGEAVTLSNIGGVYDALGQKEKALEYYEKALPIHREVGNRKGEAATLNNIGFAYSALGQNETALNYYEQALTIRREVGDRAGEAVTLNNIGGVYSDLGQKDKALDYYQQALPIFREVGDRAGEAVTLSNIAIILFEQTKLAEATSLMEQAVAIEEEISSPKLEEHHAVLEKLRQRLRGQ